MRRGKRFALAPFHELEFWVVLGLVMGIIFIGTTQGQEPISDPPQLSFVLPADGGVFSIGQTIVFSANPTGTEPPFVVDLYLKARSVPTSERDIIYSRGVNAGGTFSYALQTAGMERITYYWFMVVTDAQSHRSQSPVRSFELGAPESIPSETTDAGVSASSNTVSDSGNDRPETGGPGGHYSDHLGEKTGYFFPLRPGKEVTMKFSQKKDIHKIYSLTIHAIDKLGPETFIIHQELENHFLGINEEGVGDVIAQTTDRPVHPFFHLFPEGIEAYKAIHIHQTIPTQKRFTSTVTFLVPDEWLTNHHLTTEDVVVEWVDRKTLEWNRAPVVVTEKRTEGSLYSVSFEGLPPFVIGARKKTTN